MTLILTSVVGTDDLERSDETPLASPYLNWITGGKPNLSGGSAVDSGAFTSSTTRPETLGPGCFIEANFDGTATPDNTTYFVGARLSSHSNSATGYIPAIEFGTGGGWLMKIRRNTSTVATSEKTDYTDVTGIRVVCVDSTIIGYIKTGGEWVEAVSVVDDTYQDAGYVGFGLTNFFGSPVGIESITWGTATLPITPVGDRFYARLEPIAYDDEAQDYALRNLAIALAAPLEVTEISRDTATGLVGWESLWDPDVCPAALLDWLAIANGIELPPSALTESEKRYRIKQAAGRYRGTPRALVEEVQLVLDENSPQTVLMEFQTPDRWSYLVGTVDAETPDEDAVDAAIERQNPAFMLWERVLTSDWSNFVLAPTLIAIRDGDGYAIGEPTYPTCQSVLDAFATCADLEANTPI